MNELKKKELSIIFGVKGNLNPGIKKGYEKFLPIIEKMNAIWPDDKSMAEKLYLYLHDMNSPPTCPTCNKNKNGFLNFQTGYSSHCSKTCSRKDRDVIRKSQETLYKHYGVYNPNHSEEIKAKTEQTNLEKYGYKNPFQCPSIKEKSKKTCLRKYGTKHASQAEIIKEKVKETNRRLRGVDYSLQCPLVREQIEKTSIERYGFKTSLLNTNVKKKGEDSMFHRYGVRKGPHVRMGPNTLEILNSPEKLQELLFEYPVSELEKILSIEHSTIYKKIREYGLINELRTSKYKEEEEIKEFLNELGVDYNTHNKILLGGKEIDFLIPKYNLAIEFNGLYWHSEYNGKDKHYHLEKTMRCLEKGIQLFHIFDNEWKDDTKREIWKSMIRGKLNLHNMIMARKCEIKNVSVPNHKLFFDENHIQGGLLRGKGIGLFYNDKLVSCISYGPSRFNKDEVEIYRFASLLNTCIVGGFSKLLKQVPSERIISYANRRWSEGKVYEKTGFIRDSITPPNYFYFRKGDDELYNRIEFQKHKLKGKLKEFDISLSEVENMFNNGYHRIFDCGNIKYILERNL